MNIPEPCMCGDPECPNCFPRYEEDDGDELYEKYRQEEIDGKYHESIKNP